MITIWVVPGARRTEIVGRHGDALKIRVAAPPEAGKANRELTTLLAQVTGSRVRLMRGAASRRKVVLVEGVSSADLGRMVERASE